MKNKKKITQISFRIDQSIIYFFIDFHPGNDEPQAGNMSRPEATTSQLDSDYFVRCQALVLMNIKAGEGQFIYAGKSMPEEKQKADIRVTT